MTNRQLLTKTVDELIEWLDRLHDIVDNEGMWDEEDDATLKEVIERLSLEPNEAVQAGAEDSQVGSPTADSSPPLPR